MKRCLHVLTALLVASLLALPAHARDGGGSGGGSPASDASSAASLDHSDASWKGIVNGARTLSRKPLNVSAAANTVTLGSYKFDSGATCTQQGWTVVDMTAQTGTYWHVDDFAPANFLGHIPPGHISTGGQSFTAIDGSKSMWMGKRSPVAGPVDTIHCNYGALPGYGNGWNQALCSKICLTVSGGTTPDLDIAFDLKCDSEPDHDFTSLEYTTACSGEFGWSEIDSWHGAQSVQVATSYNTGGGPIRVRFRFYSDRQWSNQDGYYHGFGVALDNLSAEALAVEDFEGEALGANDSNDWQTCNPPGYGSYMALFKKASANYQDPNVDNLSCYWAAINGSTEFYNCGTPPQPAQRIVPHVNVRGQYLWNEIWSPVMPFGNSTGGVFRLHYDVYRDLPLDNLVFYTWRVRTIGSDACPRPWRGGWTKYYGDSKDWHTATHFISPYIRVVDAISMQVAIGVIDMCKIWSPQLVGTCACHSPAPYIDKVKVTRTQFSAPQFVIKDSLVFQDVLANLDLGPFVGLYNGFIPTRKEPGFSIDNFQFGAATSPSAGDSMVIDVSDPETGGAGIHSSGLLDDPVLSTFIGRDKTKKQLYMWVQVWPYDAVDNPSDKVGADLSDGPGGQANRYPFAGTQLVNGTLWTKIRADYTYTGSPTNPADGTDVPFDPYVENSFNIDLNDNLFTPGDTIYYFFGATSANGTTYYSSNWEASDDINAVAANPMEVTILPAGGSNRGGDILYIDGADGSGNQNYFTGAFQVLGLLDRIDRYDVLEPSSANGNRPGLGADGAELASHYSKIIWDCGNFAATLGDDDYSMLVEFLGNLPGPGGVYLGGDDVAEKLNMDASSSAVTFRSSYIPFTLMNNNHRLAPSLFVTSPKIIHWPGRAFSDDFLVFGGNPAPNDFDVVGSSGTSLVQMSYNTASSANGAVVSNVNGNARVMLAGFSFAYMRDDELNGISDRAQHLHDVLTFLGSTLGPVTPVSGQPTNALSQNYPNPFNPSTTIAFSIKERSLVKLSVYDVGGRLVRTLSNEAHAAGPHRITWDGNDGNGARVASGVYFYRLVAGDFSQTRKMVLLK